MAFMVRIFLKLQFFSAMASTKKIKRLQYSIFFVEAITLQGNIPFRKRFVKNGFRKFSDGYFIN